VRLAAQTLGLGGSCGATAVGTVAGTAEGSAAEVLRMAAWLRSSFHWCELGFGPELLGPGDHPLADFTSPQPPRE
jgi:hypothetical protein